jgi:hypothetical protein
MHEDWCKDALTPPLSRLNSGLPEFRVRRSGSRVDPTSAREREQTEFAALVPHLQPASVLSLLASTKGPSARLAWSI